MNELRIKHGKSVLAALILTLPAAYTPLFAQSNSNEVSILKQLVEEQNKKIEEQNKKIEALSEKVRLLENGTRRSPVSLRPFSCLPSLSTPMASHFQWCRNQVPLKKKFERWKASNWRLRKQPLKKPGTLLFFPSGPTDSR